MMIEERPDETGRPTWRPRPKPMALGAMLAMLSGCPTPVTPGVDGGTDAPIFADTPPTPDAGTPDGGALDAPEITDAGTDAPVVPDAGSDGGPPDAPVVTFSPSELAIIGTLSPLPALPADPTNAVADDPDAALLGQRLFFDARYSGPLTVASDLGAIGEAGRVSCASCHDSPVLSDERSPDPGNVSLGAGFHTRNSPALVNSSYYRWTNWGGRFSTQWELPPIVAENAAIMNSSRLAVAHHIFDHYRTEYEAIFGAMEPALGTDTTRFPLSGRTTDASWMGMTMADQDVVNRIFVRFGMLIQAYLRQLVTTETPFDAFVAGDASAMTQSQLRGLRLFIGDARCISCHSGPTFSDGLFHNLAIPQTGPNVPASDVGRFSSVPPLLTSVLNAAGPYSDDRAFGAMLLAGLTSPPPESTRGAFRTPSLRDVELTAPYMHSGQLATLEDVIAFYDVADAVPVAGTRSPLLLPLGLSETEQADLVAFLGALTSEPVPIELRSPLP